LAAETDETHSIEPDIADGDLTPRDLTFVLQNLRFGRSALATLRIDREVRDFLIRSIAPGRR
jgi:hypothetical protein